MRVKRWTLAGPLPAEPDLCGTAESANTPSLGAHTPLGRNGSYVHAGEKATRVLQPLIWTRHRGQLLGGWDTGRGQRVTDPWCAHVHGPWGSGDVCSSLGTDVNQLRCSEVDQTTWVVLDFLVTD